MAHIGQGAAEDLYPAQKVQDCAVKTKNRRNASVILEGTTNVKKQANVM